MPSHFPGIDPFIESSGKWEDFHNKLLGDMERQLAMELPPRYVVRLGERSYIDFVEPLGSVTDEKLIKPDIGIKTAAPKSQENAGVAVVEESAVDMQGLVEDEVRETFLEIRELDPSERLVTGIEVLSPSNKRPGTVGWYQYERKRKFFFEGHANLVEIDLLRGGQHRPMAGIWPDAPYYVMVVRREFAPRCKVWPTHYRTALPVIPIPLAAPDPDFKLALQPLIDAVFDRSHYAKSLDYSRPPRPPLPDQDTAWQVALLASSQENQPPS